MTGGPDLRASLWFAEQAPSAAEFYRALLPDSRIYRVEHHPESQQEARASEVLLVELTFAGAPIRGNYDFTMVM